MRVKLEETVCSWYGIFGWIDVELGIQMEEKFHAVGTWTIWTIDLLSSSKSNIGWRGGFCLWKYNSSRSYSIKSFVLQVYKMLVDNSQVSSVVNKACCNFVPPRAEILVWFMLQERMNTRERLCKMGIIQPIQTICPMCQQEVESVEHLFCGCNIAWRF